MFKKKRKHRNSEPSISENSPFPQDDQALEPMNGEPSQRSVPDLSHARILPRPQHGISRRSISPSALKIMSTLDNNGYQAFLVGGSVRDLLLGNKPKDFDIATNATPEELKRLFRNARIIGRRFRIVHIRFGREIIEVTTFRASHDPGSEQVEYRGSKQLKNLDSAHSSEGMLLRDNVYGNIQEDALRRDFTVNGLYYTLHDFQVLDFSTGIEDLQNRQLRVIGDPRQRYKEDPVRMLRAIRFAAKLGFSIEERSQAPIDEMAYLLESISTARLFDEAVKLLSSGYGEKAFALLKQYRLGDFLFPFTMDAIRDETSPAARLVNLALQNTDQRIASDKSVTPAFLLAALLWPVLVRHHQSGGELLELPMPQLQQLANEVLADQLTVMSIPRRFTLACREIWEMQARLQRRNRRSVMSAFQHPRFRAAYDFLLLREAAGESLNELGKWWTEFQVSDTNQQTQMLNALTGKPGGRRRPRRRRTGNSR